MDFRQRQSLDRYITGNYGEDQFRQGERGKKMGVKMRQLVEREITEAVVDALLAANFRISVDNGEEESAPFSEKATIMKHLFTTDEDRLHVDKNGESFGWVRLIYGNDGWDVISDYTTNLESFIGDQTKVQAIVDKYAD